ncbi:MAG: glycosyl-4,4'-diaponeurosporenoate acyltransferase [Sporolactobacillus sp.]|nr:glycosyl-4,4'-diaponeurosporenoate acyltransferase [Sporolactobacillus sp.]MCI1882263.1 glycosyl-4,4'-diaponeurosporenoate acyltransferase [Sporolactobacillus sp.]
MKSTTLTGNLFIFFIISVINTAISIRLPLSLFRYDSWLFRVKHWEKGGKFYQHYLYVKKWKNLLPELSDFLSFLFSKKQMMQYDPVYLSRFIVETCRAELVHWCIIVSSFIFTYWNTIGMSIVMICIAVALNLPYIIIQRYNRPRILSILAYKKANLKGTMINDLEILHKDI